MDIVQNISLDFVKCSVYKTVEAKQNDSKSRFVNITFYNDGKKYIPPKNVIANFRAVKPDGKMIWNKAVLNEDGTVTVEFTQQTLAVSGKTIADVFFTDENDTVLSTATFIINVIKSPIGEEVDSENEFLMIQEIIADVKKELSDLYKKVESHNTDPKAHEDIRTEISNTKKDLSALDLNLKSHNTDPKAHEDIRTEIGNLSSLKTNSKNNLVDAINEIHDNGGSGGGTDIGLGITGASIDQFLLISSVDENGVPTAYKTETIKKAEEMTI